MNTWIDYKSERPDKTGVCEWRVPSKTLPGEFVLVAAHMRKRGAGYTDTISPVFDHWDGYRVHVPDGLQWRSTDEHKEVDWSSIKLLGVENLKHMACMYCGKIPTLNAMQQSGWGITVCASPEDYNRWWLTCCAWGKTPDGSNPRRLEEVRRGAYAKAASILSDVINFPLAPTASQSGQRTCEGTPVG